MAINLDSITSDPSMAPPRVVLYGPQKIGKTTFGARAPSPILLPLEDGIGKLNVPHFPLLSSFSEVMDALGALYEGEHKFSTVVVDSLDWLEPHVWAHTCKKHGWANIETPGYGRGYVEADVFWKQFLEGLDALRNDRGLAIVLLAHTEVRQYASPDADPFDRYQIKLHKRAAGFMREWPDALLFANYKTFTTKTEAGFNRTITRGVGTGERVMYTEERPAFYAGNRYSLPHELPLDWQAFESALAGDTTTTEAA